MIFNIGKEIMTRNYVIKTTFKIFRIALVLTFAFYGSCLADGNEAGLLVAENPVPVPESNRESNPPVTSPPSFTDSGSSPPNHEIHPSQSAVPAADLTPPVIVPTPTPVRDESEPTSSSGESNAFSGSNPFSGPVFSSSPVGGNIPAGQEEPEKSPVPESVPDEDNTMPFPDGLDDDSDNEINPETDSAQSLIFVNTSVDNDFQEKQEEQQVGSQPAMIFSTPLVNQTSGSEDDSFNDNDPKSEAIGGLDDDNPLTLEIMTDDGDLLELLPEETITIPLYQTNSPGTSGGLDLSVYTIEDPDLNMSNLRGDSGSQYWVIDTPGIYNIDTSSVGMFFTTMNAFAILIEVANVILNGNGITINGDAGADSVGVLVKDVSNVIY